MIKTRFSPSPTGLLHLGNVRAALFSALYAASQHGHFVLRIEDTDESRSEEKFTELLQADLKWLGIAWQEGPGIGGANGPYFQSERSDIYEDYYQQLIDHQQAYLCFCSEQELALNRKLQLSRGQPPRYAGTCLNLTADDIAAKQAQGIKPTLRFRVLPGQLIEFKDSVKGPQQFRSDDIGDFIIRRAEGTSSFMFCNAIDDALMGVTHVLRGEDHLTNTPRQLLILAALQLTPASYGHLSLITGEDGAPLSKRHGSFSLHDLKQQGFLASAVLNYMARLSHAVDSQKLLSFSELAAQFQLDKISKASARFDEHQLLHWQKEAVMALTDDAAWQWLGDDLKSQVPVDQQPVFIQLCKHNLHFPADAAEWIAVLFQDELNYSAEAWSLLQSAGSDFFHTCAETIKQFGVDQKVLVETLKTNHNLSGKKLFMPLRVVLTGLTYGPELPTIMQLLGQERLLARFEQAAVQTRSTHANL